MQTAQSSAASYVDPDTLSPETGEPFSKATTARYLVAFVIFAILNCAAFVLNGNTLMPQHLRDIGYSETEATTALGTIPQSSVCSPATSGAHSPITRVPASASVRLGSSLVPSWPASACICWAPSATFQA